MGGTFQESEFIRVKMTEKSLRVKDANEYYSYIFLPYIYLFLFAMFSKSFMRIELAVSDINLGNEFIA